MIADRQGVLLNEKYSRVGNSRHGSPESVQPNGQLQGRLVCRLPESQITTICELETRSLRNGDGCFQNRLDRSSGVCIPPFLHDRPMPTEDYRGGSTVTDLDDVFC